MNSKPPSYKGKYNHIRSSKKIESTSRYKGKLPITRTPMIKTTVRPRNLFNHESTNDLNNTHIEIVPIDTNLEILLLKTLIINATKVQTVVESFVRNKDYSTIFCFTETKVDSLDFEPIGIKIFSKHRKKKEK